MNKVLETFDGFVDVVDGETAYVTLVSKANGDKLSGEYPTAKLFKKDITEGDSFVLHTEEVENDEDCVRIVIEKVPDRELSSEECESIRRKIEEAFPRLVRCITKEAVPDFIFDKLYKVVPGENESEKVEGRLRVIDENGENYLYPLEWFEEILY